MPTNEENYDNNPVIIKPRRGPGRPRKRRYSGSDNVDNLSNKTKKMLFELREYRMQRLPSHKIMHEMNITNITYYRLMNMIEKQDIEMLALQSKGKLQSEIALYEQTAGEVVSINLEIARDSKNPPEARQVSSQIALDAAMTVVKIHSEGPRVLQDVYGPVGQYIAVQGQPLPLPDGIDEKDAREKVKVAPIEKDNEQT